MLRKDLGGEAASRFQVVSPLGSGGFGAVYEAVDQRTQQRVALKELDNTSGDAIARFKHEFRALADCHHPNLVGLYELIEQNGRWMIVMELVPGMDLTEYVRGDDQATIIGDAHRFDEGRLRSAFAGVVEGLIALHNYGILHRDLKPSNIRVRPDGRAVLLDFGLATSTNPEQQSMHGLAVGTLRYMAPEQAAGKAVGPATDLYAVGVCLFEALTGRPPFDGDSAITILLAKQQEEAPRASSFNRSAPSDLDELCARLLSVDPTARPSAEDVLYTLGGEGSRPQALIHAPAMPSPEQLFAGRERELEHLARALAATHRGELRIVLVEGESGVGKSELVAEFLRRTAAEHSKLLALRGRCYENEHVSYKAFDGCVDELSKFLRRLPEAECAAMLPVRAGLLGQLFPVLKNIRQIARAPRDDVAMDPTARRLDAFEALAELLRNIAADRPLVLVVDDLQWADSESFRMLQALVERPDPPPLLVLATVRPRDELEGEVFTHVNAVRSWKMTDVVPVFGLPRAQAKALAAKLLGAQAPDKWLEMIADESDGHPLFLSELVHYTQSHDLGSRGSLTLDAALRARIERLDKPSRELLEIVAIAARPHGTHIFARALSTTAIEEPARRLLAAKLLRLRKGQELGCYHDRIRHTASDLVASSRAMALHRRLAAALSEARNVDPAEQAHHWDHAGDTDRAIEAYELAVKRAVETLAFTRAAQLCARALELIGNPNDERAHRLRAERARSLACAGLSKEAAALFQEAADASSGHTRILLRSSAAQQLMLSGRMGDGVRAAQALLSELGFRASFNTLGSLLSLIWQSVLVGISLRRDHGRKLEAETDDPATRLRLEVLDEILRVLALVDPVASISLNMQQLRLARRAGFGASYAALLSAYGALITMKDNLAKALPIFERSRRELASYGSQPRLEAIQAYYEGAGRVAGFDWAGGITALERADQLVRDHVPDRPYLVVTLRYLFGVARYQIGEHARLARDLEIWLAELRERNDALGEALLCGMGHGFIRQLMADDVPAAIDEVARAEGAISSEPFSFVHLGLFVATSHAHFYRRGPAALNWLDAFEPRRKRARIFMTGMGGHIYRYTRAFALLHACCAATGAERAQLASRTRAAVRAMKDPSLLGAAFRSLITAQLEALSDRKASALEHAARARTAFEAAKDYSAIQATMLEGLLESGAAAETKRGVALAFFRQQGWRDPMSAAAMFLPVLPLLMPPSELRGMRSAKRLLGRFEVIDSVGGGGFGSVVAARDVTGRVLAIKELVRSHGKALERFKREFRALQDVHHENLARLDELLEHEGRWYIAMELITGSELAEHVRPGGRCDADRLKQAFVGVCEGLRALHEAGFVHRDVTPRNVRVTAGGRAVLLDFGLIARSGDATESPVGTNEYASPEQLAGHVPHARDDLYAVGVCMHECMTGRLPERGSPQSTTPGPKSSQLSTVTRELAPLFEICRRLLSSTAEHRPTLTDVLRVLQDGKERTERTSGAPADAYAALRFSGREAELDQLRTAFENTCDDGLTLAFVEGESGVGKSALVNEFAERLSRSWPTLQVLGGRCYENERLPYKAFDGAIDRLATLLRQLPNPRCEALMPKKAALLAQLFPVLTSVPAIARASKKGLPADPAAQKREACECLIELLANLSAQQELLFVIDDLQWADSESFALLHALFRQRERIPMLFLCTVRPKFELDDRAAREIEALERLPNSERIELEGLSDAAAREFAAQVHGAPLSDERLAALLRESKGHPLFLRELIAQDKRGAHEQTSSLTLNGALRTHIAALPESAQRLLALVALAGRPHPAHVYALALELEELPRETIIALLADGLLRRRGGNELACYHDRIRTVAIARVPVELRRELAGKLASALETAHVGEPGERARLWDEAEEHAHALDAHEQAGDRALEGLAFAQAAESYGRAIELLESARPDDAQARARKLLEQRGHALVRAGRSAEAARCYQLAATSASGDAEVRLRIWAAQHLIKSAQVRDGLDAARDLLAELGSPLPKSERSALLSMAWERTRLRMRGLKLKERRRSVPTSERLLLEALHGLSSPVRAFSYLPGSSMIVRYLRRALEAGEPVHTARALAFEALFRTTSSPHIDQSALFEQSRELAARMGEPALIAEVDLLRGLACIASNQFALSVTHLSKAHELLLTRCPGEPWLLTTARMYLGLAWFTVVDMAAIARHTGEWIEEAKARDDRYALAAISGFGSGSVRHLFADRPDDAISELEQAIAPWPEEVELFGNVHLGVFCGQVYARTYRDPRAALAWIDSGAERRSKTYLMRMPAGRDAEILLTTEIIFRLLAQAGAPDKAQLLARAGGYIHKLRASPSPRYQCEAQTFAALLTFARGERSRAHGMFTEAVRAAEPFGERLGYCARYFEGALEGGEVGRAKCATIVDIVRSHGWTNLDRALALYVPGIGLLKE